MAYFLPSTSKHAQVPQLPAKIEWRSIFLPYPILLGGDLRLNWFNKKSGASIIENKPQAYFLPRTTSALTTFQPTPSTTTIRTPTIPNSQSHHAQASKAHTQFHFYTKEKSCLQQMLYCLLRYSNMKYDIVVKSILEIGAKPILQELCESVEKPTIIGQHIRCVVPRLEAVSGQPHNVSHMAF